MTMAFPAGMVSFWLLVAAHLVGYCLSIGNVSKVTPDVVPKCAETEIKYENGEDRRKFGQDFNTSRNRFRMSLF